MAITTAFLRRTFSICAVKGQAFSLLGRLEGLGTGGAAALTRRSFAAQQEQMWSRQRPFVSNKQEICREEGNFTRVSCQTSLFFIFILVFLFWILKFFVLIFYLDFLVLLLILALDLFFSSVLFNMTYVI